MSLIELDEHKLLMVCVYRSPDGPLDKFLNKLELVIQKLLMKDKILILCGDRNIDFLHEDGDINYLKDLLLRYDVINTVQSPTRIIKTRTLIDVIIINKKNYGTCNSNQIRIIRLQALVLLWHQRARSNVSTDNALDIPNVIAYTFIGVWHVVKPTHSVAGRPTSAAIVVRNTRPRSGAVQNGKRPRRPL
jgi:hypothetical protein